MAEFQVPPSIDPVAARRWALQAPARSPWLHEEVGRRMADRLQWIMQKPAVWGSWQPAMAGMEAHRLVAAQFPQARCVVMDEAPSRLAHAQQQLQARWWSPDRWRQPALRFGTAAAGEVNMLWANMALHASANPQALLQEWHSLLAVDGYLMFSCLGPDTLKELRQVYAGQGWGPVSHDFTDMHDWGDMLVQAGFAEPVMDMERIVLSYSSAEKLREELRELGRNLHRQRHGGLRGRRWLQAWDLSLAGQLADAQGGGRLEITFEIIYGHAFKPAPKIRVQGESHISVEDMQRMLRAGKRGD